MNNLTDLIAELNMRRRKYKRSFPTGDYISAWLEDEVLIDRSSAKPIKALVVILRTNGCSWARNLQMKHPRTDDLQNNLKTDIKKKIQIQNSSKAPIGGCTMCGYINDCAAEPHLIQAKDLIHQFMSALARFEDKEFKMVKIFTSGSFFDNGEVTLEAREKIVRTLNERNIKNLIIESRPEFINAKILDEMTSGFNGRLQIAIGLESCNDDILKYCINKGFYFEDYRAAVELSKDYGLSIKTYLLLKPPLLSERDAIFDVVNSIRTLAKNDMTDVISINPVNIQKFTVVEHLYTRLDYRPPWLWSVIKALVLGHKIISTSNKNIRLLSSPTGGGTNRGAHNCFGCDKLVLDKISKFSMDNDTGVFHDLECNCKDNWLDVLILENVIKSKLNGVVG